MSLLASDAYDAWKLRAPDDERDLEAREEILFPGCPQARWCSAVAAKLLAQGWSEDDAEAEALRRWRAGQ